MRLPFFLFSTLSSVVLLSSCTKPVDPFPKPSGDPGYSPRYKNTTAAEDQKALQAQREAMQKEAARRQAEIEAQANGAVSPTLPTNQPTGAAPAQKVWPFGTPVPGKEGFVYSPYNSKVIDVSTIPSGTLVRDPDDLPGSKQFFRVP